ncbi:MAG: hypothetical protein WCJ87_03105 [Burkholderiales bacterium]
MPHKPFAPKHSNKRQFQDQRQHPGHERRATRGPLSSARWLRGLLVRPLALKRRGLQWDIVLVDRRLPRESPVSAVESVREALRLRLLRQGPHADEQSLIHLEQVYDALGRNGWDAVEALSARTLGKSLLHMQMMLDEQDSEPLAQMRDRLRAALMAAESREEGHKHQVSKAGAKPGPAVEVSEATHEDFEASERRWAGAVAEGEPPAARD